MLALSACLTALFIVWVALYARHGVDYTDEGFYLNWISNPFLYSASISQFGFFYHPLYLLADGNIGTLRQLNFLFTLLLGGTAAWTLLGKAFAEKIDVATKLVVASGLACLTLLSAVFAGMWIPTPSYNALAFQGLLISVTGLLMAATRQERASALGYVIVGLGGWVAFLGKPTSAAALAVLVVLYLVFSGHFRWQSAWIPAATAAAAALVTALVTDGGVLPFIHRNTEGLRLAGLLDANAGGIGKIFRMDGLSVDLATALALLLGAALSFASLWATKPLEALPRTGRAALPVVALVGVAGLGYFALSKIQGENRALVLFALAAGALLPGFFSALRSGARQTLPLCVLLAALPYAYAFGSSNSYWVSINGAVFFVALAAAWSLRPLVSTPHFPQKLVLYTLLLQIALAGVVQGAFLSPYRQLQPLYSSAERVDFGGPGKTLLLSSADNEYVTSFNRLARDHGFSAGTPMLDLSGNSPGILFALQATSIGVPWSLGGYPGSQGYVQEALKKVPCDQLVAAWLVSEPKGVGTLSPEILNGFGADLERDYQVVGSTVHAVRKTVQWLHRPQRDSVQAVKACESNRKREQ